MQHRQVKRKAMQAKKARLVRVKAQFTHLPNINFYRYPKRLVDFLPWSQSTQKLHDFIK